MKKLLRTNVAKRAMPISTLSSCPGVAYVTGHASCYSSLAQVTSQMTDECQGTRCRKGGGHCEKRLRATRSLRRQSLKLLVDNAGRHTQKDEVLTLQEEMQIIMQIESGRLQRSLKVNKEHVAHVKKIVERN